MLELSATANYKEVRTATMALQTKLLLNPDGAFGPKTLAAYKKATTETPVVTATPAKAEAQAKPAGATPEGVVSAAPVSPAATFRSMSIATETPAPTVASL